jgi:hypothetical protein
MTPSQTCHTCGEARAAGAFKLLRSGTRAAMCTPCTKAAAALAREDDLQARLAARRRFNGARKANLAAAKEAAAVAREADRQAKLAALKFDEKGPNNFEAPIPLTTAQQAVQHAQRGETQEQRRERAAALRDDIWDAMRTGRYRRAATAIRPDQTATHRIKLAHGGGFISIAELACRCVEREATGRAAATCKTFESAAAASRILERATATLDRKKEVGPLWRGVSPQTPLGGLSDDPDINEGDLFEEAFGDWAPSWAATAVTPWPASRAG